MSCQTNIRHTHYSRQIVYLAGGAILLFIVGGVSVCAGAYHISFSEILRVIWANITGGGAQSLSDTIVWQIRLPRLITAVFVGAGLSVSGAVFQSALKNPLAEPHILGVSAGAAFGAALSIVFPLIFRNMEISAVLFSILAVSVSYFLSRARGQTQAITLILAGVVTASLFSAALSIIKYISNSTELREIVFYLMGGLYYSSWRSVLPLSVITAACCLIIWALGWKLNVLSLGDNEAKSLGVNADLYRLIFIILASLTTAVSVASVGVIAWVGLMIPHLCRMVLGVDNRFLIPACALAGAAYLTACDTIARTLIPAEIPIGIITSILAAPYILYLLHKKGENLFR